MAVQPVEQGGIGFPCEFSCEHIILPEKFGLIALVENLGVPVSGGPHIVVAPVVVHKGKSGRIDQHGLGEALVRDENVAKVVDDFRSAFAEREQIVGTAAANRVPIAAPITPEVLTKWRLRRAPSEQKAVCGIDPVGAVAALGHDAGQRKRGALPATQLLLEFRILEVIVAETVVRRPQHGCHLSRISV